VTNQGRCSWINNYLIALQTVNASGGAMLGWKALVQPQLESGQFVQLTPDAVAAPKPLYMTVHRRASSKARVFAEWLLNEQA